MFGNGLQKCRRTNHYSGNGGKNTVFCQHFKGTNK